jgi:hypothetical protein
VVTHLIKNYFFKFRWCDQTLFVEVFRRFEIKSKVQKCKKVLMKLLPGWRLWGRCRCPAWTRGPQSPGCQRFSLWHKPEIKSNQIKASQIKSNQIKPEIKSNLLKILSTLRSLVKLNQMTPVTKVEKVLNDISAEFLF